ncbi:MAG: DUF4384 domain-containing protein [Candidatus Melainabacteria bacterium]|nr:DUF4384 domain-containing protein [Candidatus Melainabacteria bacterium]
MITKKRTAITAVLSFTLALPLLWQPAVAADSDKSEPTFDEMKKGKDRGLFIEPPTYHKDATVKAPKTTTKEPPKEATKTVPATSAAIKVSPKAVIKPAPKSKIKADLVPVKAAPQAKSTSSSSSSSSSSLPKHAVAKAGAKSKSDKSKVTKSSSHITVIANEKSQEFKNVSLEAADPIIKAWLNKPGSLPKYRDGEKMEVNVTASQDCNLSIFDYDGKGKLTQIFPNEYQQSSSVRAGETVTIGGAKSEFEYQVSTLPGESKIKEHIFVFAYPTNEAPISIAMTRASDSPFRSADITMEQYRKLVNESKSYFSREVKITPKGQSQIKQVANEISNAKSSPNKVELSFQIEK